MFFLQNNTEQRMRWTACSDVIVASSVIAMLLILRLICVRVGLKVGIIVQKMHIGLCETRENISVLFRQLFAEV